MGYQLYTGPFKDTPPKEGWGQGVGVRVPWEGVERAGPVTKECAHRNIANFVMNARNAEADTHWYNAGEQRMEVQRAQAGVATASAEGR